MAAAAKLARAGFGVVAASPTEVVARMHDTYSVDAIILDHDLNDEAIKLLKRIALLSSDTVRIVVGGDPSDTQELRESGVVDHHIASLDVDTLTPLLRGDQDEEDGPQAGEPEVDGEAG